MTVSIRDVAKTAGISVSTVSRALNGYTDVSEKTRKKIQKTVQELGYIPNQSAKNLSSKTNQNIALIISDLGKEEKLDEFTGNILRGAYEYVNGRGITIATYGIDARMQRERTLRDLCAEYSLAGVMLLGMRIQDPYLVEAKELDIPCVLIDTHVEGKNTATVTTDDRKAFEEITDYVLDKGYQEVVLIKGRQEAEVTHKRFQGFQKSLEKHHLLIQQSEICLCDFREEEAFKNARAYIEKYGKSRARAFICMSDIMALGVCRAIHECGYEIPEDFSVTGFDGLYTLRYIKPGITTIDQNISAKGYEGMRLLYEMLQGKHESFMVYVPYKLIVRDSVNLV